MEQSRRNIEYEYHVLILACPPLIGKSMTSIWYIYGEKHHFSRESKLSTCWPSFGTVGEGDDGISRIVDALGMNRPGQKGI